MKSSRPLSSYRYVSKPVVIEAVPVSDICDATSAQSTGDGLPMWVFTLKGNGWDCHNDGIVVYTLEGAMFGGPTDYLIRGTAGELYPCNRDVFLFKYEAVA